ncbi:MAG: hypothetical protein QXW82_05595, partial [Candidatus Bathyarchaeia archaeon]
LHIPQLSRGWKSLPLNPQRLARSNQPHILKMMFYLFRICVTNTCPSKCACKGYPLAFTM